MEARRKADEQARGWGKIVANTLSRPFGTRSKEYRIKKRGGGKAHRRRKP
jgi:hypothetical protein